MIKRTYKLGEVCNRLSSGKSIKASDISDSGDYPVYGGNGIRGFTNKYNFDGECSVIGRQGAYCGNVQLFKGKAYMTEHAVIACGNEHANSYYLGYLLSTMDLGRLSHQAAQPGLSVKVLSEQEIELPTRECQDKIVEVISNYDNLIENNQKQIKLLEEAAQRLYKEWFVDLRFPGHEDVAIVDGVPEGWKRTTIGNETDVRRGGSPRPIQDYLSNEGLNWLKISDATISNNPFIYLIKEKIRPEGLKKTVFLKAGTIILSNSATPGLPRILKVDTCIHDGWLYFPNLQLSNEYMYHLFLQIREDLVNRGTGAVFTNLKTDILKNYEFIKPDENLLALFDDKIKPIFSMVDNLSKQVILLQENRNRLLPKLMSGEIEV